MNKDNRPFYIENLNSFYRGDWEQLGIRQAKKKLTKEIETEMIEEKREASEV